MGLDMYLEGRTFNWDVGQPAKEMRDGFRVKGVTLDLGYWRKHPDLHGFIVQTFAGGKDECQEIPLNDDAIVRIITAIKERRLPHTDGFFFGRSDPSRDKESVEIFERALKWLEGETPPRAREPRPLGVGGAAVQVVEVKDFVGARESREVIYRASW